MKQYLEGLSTIYNSHNDHPDRTKVGRRSIFGMQERYNLAHGFPLVTTRKIAVEPLIKELLWFLRGDTNVKPKAETDDSPSAPRFWDRWAVTEEDIRRHLTPTFGDRPDTQTEEEFQALIEQAVKSMSSEVGAIGPMYGQAWRNAPRTGTSDVPERALEELPSDKMALWTKEYEEIKFLSRADGPRSLHEYANLRYKQTVDQLNELILNLKARPHSSRHCVTAWVPEWIPTETDKPQDAVLKGFGCLAPCHAFFQYFVRPADIEGAKKILDCQLYLRSSDRPVGYPYNIAQYALLLSMIAQVADMVPGELVMTSGDAHIYANQMEINGLEKGVETQLTRTPLPLPTLWLNPEVKDIFAFTEDDIRIEEYTHHAAINYPLAV